MKIYLLRHGIATERMEPGQEDDSRRPLTEKGRDQVGEIARALKKSSFKPDLILSSPYVRADQTATILAGEFHLKKHLEYTDLLLPEAQPGPLIDSIVKDHMVDELVLVGHYPSMGWLLSALLGQDVGDSISLRKGGICRFSSDDFASTRTASLDWLLTPAFLLKVSS